MPLVSSYARGDRHLHRPLFRQRRRHSLKTFLQQPCSTHVSTLIAPVEVDAKTALPRTRIARSSPGDWNCVPA